MNKILLSFGVAALTLTSVFAQTNAITSGNMPVNSGAGYVFEFNGTTTDNCTADKIPNPGISYPGIVVDSVGNGSLHISNDAEGVAWGNLALRLFDGNCDDYNFDMSSSANQRIEVKIKSSVDLDQFMLLLGDGSGAVNDSLGSFSALKAGVDTVLVFETVDFHQWASTDLMDNSDIANIHLYFRHSSSEQVKGTFEIDYIKLGTAPVGLDNGVKGESISVYPNPATTNVNFEKELENVTIYNVVGLQVYEAQSATSVDVSAFESGVYYIQHSLGTSRFTVQ